MASPITRRRLLHAGCTAAVATLIPSVVDRAEARFIRGALPQFLSPLQSQRNVINVWYPASEWNYAYIDHLVMADNAMTPYGTTFLNAWSATKTFAQVVDQNGWVNDSSGSGQTWGCGVKMPSSSNFAGPYVLTWDGDGKCQFVSETWTEASTSIVRSGNANGTTTLSGFSDVTGISLGFGVSGTGVSGGTTVVSINYSTKSIVVSASVTTGSGVSFTFTNNTYTKNANGQWTNTTGGKGYVVVSNSGYTGPPNLIGFQIATTGLGGSISVSSMSWSGGLVTVTTAAPHGRPLGYSLALTFAGATPSSINSTFTCTVTGASTYTFHLAVNPGSITGTITYIAFVSNVRLYRLADETDFMPTSVGGNGYIFRRPYKQVMVDMRPAAIRLLNWVNGNDSILYRFENRSLPTKAGSTYNTTAGPAYGPTSGTNQMTLAAISSPFVGNKNLTTSSMVHGEVAQTRVTNTITGANVTINGITKANPGVVTTSGSHGFANGTQVWLAMSYAANAPAGMTQLDRVAAIVANATATTFELTDLSGVNINTSTFSTFTGGTVSPYVSLQVGSGNDRVAYPVVLGYSGNGAPKDNVGTQGLTGNSYYTFYFDKNQAGRRTAGSGTNWVQGAWLLRDNAAWGDVPLEHCAALVAEINLLSVSQGISTPIHLWITTPPTCLLDCDPDYSAQSDYPLNAINAIFNGGYGCTGLSATNASLIWEWSNELWNFGSFASNYTNWLCYVRGAQNIANFESIQALRSTRMVRSVRSSSAWSSRVYTTLGMQGARGWDVQNQYVALGNLVDPSNIIFTDPWNNWGSATPVSFHDAVNPATYLDPTSSYTDTVSGTGTLTDDSAMYNGTNNTSNGGGNYTGAANPTQAIANFVSNIVNNASGQTIAYYCSQASPGTGILAQFNTAMVSLSKRVIQYEGGTDWPCLTGRFINSHQLTANDSLFVNAVAQSSAWASAQFQFFDNIKTLSNHGPPALYLYLKNSTGDLQWGYVAPDSYSGGVEGAALTGSQMWIAMAARNAALPV